MSAPNPTVPRRQILTGDALERLRTLPDRSVDCVVTSPPYFRLRDYGIPGQLGLETSIVAWVDHLAAIAAEVSRVLIPTGTVWLNLGDSYSTHPREGAARKSLLLGPERLAQRLSTDGWALRNKIVWAKPSTTPSSVRDRLCTTHELIYLFARQPSYYFDLDAIRIPHTSRPPRRRRPPPPSARPPSRREKLARPGWLGPNADDDRGLADLHARGSQGHPLGKNPGDVWHDPVTRFRGGHSATSPLSLVERMLRAGCPERRCTSCRSPWRRPLHRTGDIAVRGSLTPTCTCQAVPEPGLVLDPFMGAGTTALAAQRLRRDWLGIELNPAYVRLATARLDAAQAAASTATSSTTKRR